MAPRRAQVMTTALRSFLRFLLQTGKINADLGASVPSVANWPLSTIPKYLTVDQVERVIRGSVQRTSIGRRNHAILLLLARLGLRAGEVTALELGDLDWRSGELVVRGKRTSRDRFPLTEEVGAAVAAYVRHDRPRCSSRSLFIRAVAPWRGLSSPMIGTIVKEALKRAGVQAPSWGSHVLRHSLATTLLSGGATLAQVGDVLRHRSVQTTEIYAKVDLQALRLIARPWPEKIAVGSSASHVAALDYPDVDPEGLRPLARVWPTKEAS